MNQFLEAFQWVSDTAEWTVTGGIADRLVEHLVYTLVVLAFCSVIAIPVGWAIGHTGRGRGLALAASTAARSLPTLGLVTLLALLLGIGLAAPMIALVVLALPSVLAGAYSGIEAIDRATIDSARAQGMTGRQILTRVEIPLGLPLLIGGLRSAALQIIATATLAAYVGAGGLGRFLFLGLKSRDYPMMLGGSLVVVALAIVIDLLFALLARIAVPAGVRTVTTSPRD